MCLQGQPSESGSQSESEASGGSGEGGQRGSCDGAREGREPGVSGAEFEAGVLMSGLENTATRMPLYSMEKQAALVAVVRPMAREAADVSESTIVVKGNNTLKDLFLYFFVYFYILYALV